MSETVTFTPVGSFHCLEHYPYDAPRQATLAGENWGVVRLQAGLGLEYAVRDLEGFSRIWLLFWFDRNRHWRPTVQPPRHLERKVGVFASRSPYRPNPIGLSCVRLEKVCGLELVVSGHDLLDGTPILDIKPYLPYADAFPDAAAGWTAVPDEVCYEVRLAPEAQACLAWLEANGVPCLRGFIQDRLCLEPLNPRRSRLLDGDSPDVHILAYRTWRIPFVVNETTVTALTVLSGYAPAELSAPEDPYHDKELHRRFAEWRKSRGLEKHEAFPLL
ncbi:MAG: tRNA (N6-threonylcarbamoyladenosine(37)-N6)-methyltransferase TrmO [Victivallales bacterium]|nr:tRNA (N6-threonylcarbamoyladenosine(37)-N6)-methyltransferase TrmO [Victivallales bacterium]